MLLGLTEPLTGYETFPLWLTFEKAGRIEVEARSWSRKPTTG